MPASTSRRGVGLLAFLGLILLALKLLGAISWSWWIVLAPFYLPTLLGALVTVGIMFLLVLASVLR